jgi:hypothetical protein
VANATYWSFAKIAQRRGIATGSALTGAAGMAVGVGAVAALGSGAGAIEGVPSPAEPGARLEIGTASVVEGEGTSGLGEAGTEHATAHAWASAEVAHAIMQVPHAALVASKEVTALILSADAATDVTSAREQAAPPVGRS